MACLKLFDRVYLVKLRNNAVCVLHKDYSSLVDSSLRTTNTEKQIQSMGLQLLEPSRRPRSGIVFHWPWTQTIPTNA